MALHVKTKIFLSRHIDPDIQAVTFTVLLSSETRDHPDAHHTPVYNHGCQAGSIRQRLSRLLAAATSVFTLLSPPSNWARLWRRVMMAVTAFWTRDTSCWLSMFSGCPAGDRGMDVSS